MLKVNSQHFRKLKKKGVSPELVDKLDMVGISGASNLVSAIKFAKYYEMDSNDVIMTVLTDSMDLYGSRLQELTTERGVFSETDAAIAYENRLQSLSIDFVEELTYYGRKRIHNLKYYTWVEQQGKTYDEIQEQWSNDAYWTGIVKYMDEMDELIESFNEKTGLLKAL